MKKRVLPILLLLLLFSAVAYAETFNDFLSSLFGTKKDAQTSTTQKILHAPATYDGYCDTSAELDQLPPGHWCRAGINTIYNTIYSVKPNPMPINTSGQSYSNNEGVLTRSGGAFDTKRDRLLVWGGGIGGTFSPGYYDYSGNEIYAFNITNFTWSRIWGPTPNSQIISLSGGNGTYLDGNPGSRNTYDMIEYLPNQDQMWIQGGSVFASGDLAQDTWVFNLNTLTWERKEDPVAYFHEDSGSAYDPIAGHIFAIRNNQANFGFFGLYEYDPSSNLWFEVNANTKKTYGQVAAIDPVRRRILVLGSGSISAYDLITGNQLPFSTTGDTAPLFTQNPGFEYDPSTDLMIVWGGNYVSSKYVLDIYSLNLTSLVWRIHNLSSTSINPSYSRFGTFGRFRYIPSKNVFVVVNSIYELVYFYKFSPIPGDRPEITPPSISITWPILRQTVLETIQIYAEASDNYGVANVTFLLDGKPIGTVTTPPYSLFWNSYSVINGKHELVVKATDLSNNFGWSNYLFYINVKNIDTQPPTTPTNLSATPLSPYQINLSWTASTDNNNYIIGYEIRRIPYSRIIVSGTSYLDSDLNPSTAYTYNVSAFDGASNYSPNATATGVTKPSPTGGSPFIFKKKKATEVTT